MKKCKTFTTVVACVLCLAMALSGCGGGQKTTKSVAGLSGVNEFPIVEEPIVLSVFGDKNIYIESMEDNDFTRYYEDKTNVKIEWNIAAGEVRQALNLMFNSGAYCDIIMNLGFSKAEMLHYSDQGILTNLSPYIEEHGYYIKEMFEKNPVIPKELTINGGIHGLPVIKDSYRYLYKNKMWVYKPWLEKLGIEIPQTTEEFYQMLKRFKEEDPNGNGIADEIPLVARGVGRDFGIQNYLMCAFLPSDSGRLYVDEKGKVQYTAVQPEFREGLRYIKKLYDDGLLYADTFILDRTQIMSIGESETPILGAAPGMFAGMFTISNGNSPRYYEYVAIPPLEGPEGVRSAVKEKPLYTGNFVVTTDCEYPDVAVKWIDWFYSREGKELSQSDTTGTTKRPAREGELGYDGKQALYAIDKVENQATEDTGTAQKRNWHNFGVWYSDFESSVNIKNYNDVLDPNREWYNAYAAHDAYKVENFLGDLAISPEDIGEYSDILTALEEVDVSFASFVIGELSLDDDWDDYINRLKGLGLERLLEIVQKAYDLSK